MERRAFNGIDFRKQPFKGIIAEVAAEEDTSYQCIQSAIRVGNPRIVAIVTAKIERNQDIIQRSNELTGDRKAAA